MTFKQCICFDPKEAGDPGENAGGLEGDEQRVDKVLSNCIGILEACPPPQWWICRPPLSNL